MTRIVAVLVACVLLLTGAVVMLNARVNALTTPLDSTQPVVVHYEHGGVVASRATTMPLWRYVEVRRGGEDTILRAAIEADLHAKDATFHRTHEVIDGKAW
jgi:hypothetical protein